MNLVDYKVVGAVAHIVLNRPPVNALNAELATDIASGLAEASSSSVRAVVLSGGKHFAAGADIAGFVDAFDADADQDMASQLFVTIGRLEDIEKPTIAAISGFALGGGLELAMAADFRYMSMDATVGQPEIKLGIIPGGGGTQRLPRLVGYQRAKELNMSGRHVGAEEALAMGLVDRVLPSEELIVAALEDAAMWAEGPTKGYAAVKQAMNGGWGRPIDEALSTEREVFKRVFRTQDAKTGITAFLNKEKPDFIGN